MTGTSGPRRGLRRHVRGRCRRSGGPAPRACPPGWRPRCRASGCRPPSPRRGAGTSISCSAASKMLGCGFMKPCSDDDTAAVISPSSSKWLWNEARQRWVFEIRPMRMPAPRSIAQHRRHIVVQLEVLAGGPLVVDLLGACVHAAARAAHPLDDRGRVSMKQRRFVDVVARFVEHRGRGSHRRVEPRRIDRDAVAGAELLVALALERRAGIDQREIDVEEDGAGHAGLNGSGRAIGSYGPAITTDARSGSSTRRAAACTSSSVTASSSAGSRRS